MPVAVRPESPQPLSLVDGPGPPTVSLVLATTPAAHITNSDQRYLRRLANIARKRLAVGIDPVVVSAIEGQLFAAVSAAGAAGTDRGLAVVASPQRCHSVLLPYAPRSQVSTEPVFATRLLVAAAYDWPPPLVLSRLLQQLPQPPAPGLRMDEAVPS